MENILSFRYDQLRSVKNLRDLEPLLQKGVVGVKSSVPNHLDVVAAKKVLEAVIEAANAQLLPEHHFKWEALAQEGAKHYF